jgi:hypothetical protein
MKFVTSILFAAFCASQVVASDADTIFLDVTPSTDIGAYEWQKRVLVVFANSDRDPRFQDQLAMINDEVEALRDRDVVVAIDTNPAMKSKLRTTFRPHGFMILLIGKDGHKALRKPFPWDIREISRTIDKMPMRQQEMRQDN